MKALHCSSFLKTALLIVPLALCFGGSTIVQAGGKDPLSPGPLRPGNLDYRTELAQGYLKVYSATDKFNDGDAWYFPHSSYAIYTTDGKLLNNVKNQRYPADQIPQGVAFDLFGIWRRNPAMAKAAYYNLLAAALTAPVAIASGLIAWQWQLEGARLKGNLRLHLIFALSASGMIWLVCGWRVHQRRFPE